MKILICAFSILSLMAALPHSEAATPSIDSLNIQSYIRQTNGMPVTPSSANLVFAVFKGSNCIWAKRYSAVSLNAGVLNQKISGVGSTISSINNPNATAGECVANFSTTTLNSTLFMSGAINELSIRVYSETDLDGYRPIWDVPIASAPTAFVADQANLASVATVANDVIAGKKAVSSSGSSDSGKLVILDPTGKIDNSMIDQTDLSIASGQVSGLGTASATNATNTSSGSSDAGKAVVLDSSGKIDSSMLDTVSVSKGGTGKTSLNSGEVLVGNGTGAVGSIASTNGNVLVGKVSGWTSSTPDAAGLVDQTSAQTVGGNKTWSGNQTINGTVTANSDVTVDGTTALNGSMVFGNGGSSFSKILRCSGSINASSNGEDSFSCSGATSSSVVTCSPTDTPKSSWMIVSYRAKTNTVYVATYRTTTYGSWSPSFNCVVFVP